MIDNCGWLIYTKENNAGNWMKLVAECPKEAVDRMVEVEVSLMHYPDKNLEVPLTTTMMIFWILVLP